MKAYIYFVFKRNIRGREKTNSGNSEWDNIIDWDAFLLKQEKIISAVTLFKKCVSPHRTARKLVFGIISMITVHSEQLVNSDQIIQSQIRNSRHCTSCQNIVPTMPTMQLGQCALLVAHCTYNWQSSAGTHHIQQGGNSCVQDLLPGSSPTIVLSKQKSCPSHSTKLHI